MDPTDPSRLDIDNRAEPRLEAHEGSILIDGKGYPLDNWSSAGFAVMAYKGERQPGDEIDITYSLYVNKRQVQLHSRAMVIWRDSERNRLGATVVEMDEESRSQLKRILLELGGHPGG